MIPDIFLISPVRKIKRSVYLKIKRYVAKLEQKRKKVYWPMRDTNQNDPIGTRICRDNFTKMLEALEVHIWYDAKSQGSVFDFGGLFMLLVLRIQKEVVLVNEDEVHKHWVPGKKSFESVLMAIHRGEKISVNTYEKNKPH